MGANNKRLTTEQFIAKAQVVHGAGTYDYSRVVYVNSQTKVEILCPAHGAFQQVANSHLQGMRCRSCVVGAPLTTQSFISRARAVHGEAYNYSLSTYLGSTEKVQIMCPKHGLFEQEACSHLRGHGCRACSGHPLVTVDSFIAQAQAVHGVGTYDYSQTKYMGRKVKIKIGCPRHGTFEQIMSSHLSGCGCPRCGFIKRVASKTAGKEKFIAQAQAVHGVGTYDYSRVVYANARKKVVITCHRHGAFQQTPGSHTGRGNGCPDCGAEARAKGSQLSWVTRAKGRPSVLYFIKLSCNEEIFYKIGITINSLVIRYHPAKLAGYQYEILAQHTSTNPARIWEWEQSILETFSSLRYTPRRSFAGASECFSSADEILAIFPL